MTDTNVQTVWSFRSVTKPQSNRKLPRKAAVLVMGIEAEFANTLKITSGDDLGELKVYTYELKSVEEHREGATE